MSQRSRKCPRCDSASFFLTPKGYNHCHSCGREWKSQSQPGITPEKRRLKQTAEQRDTPTSNVNSNNNNSVVITAKKKRRQSLSGQQSQQQAVLMQLTKRGIDVLKRPQRDDTRVTVLALDVYRYMVDQQTKRALRIDNAPEYDLLKDAFDMLICDGDTKCNVSIHPTIYSAMARGLVQPLSVIRITSWKNWYNELEIKDAPAQVVLVTSLEVLSYASALQLSDADLRVWEKKPFNALCNDHDKQIQRPLFGSRGYYVHVLSDATVHFPPERDIDFPETIEAETIQSNMFLQELAEQFLHPKKQKRKQKAEQPTRVYGRVMRKSAVNHYAKASDEKGAFPMNFSFFIGDDSGEMRVVCWNNMCRRIFSSVDIGDIVCVDNFDLKRAFYDTVVQPLNNEQAPKREYVELAVNPNKGHVWKLPEGNKEIHDLFPLIDNNIFPLDMISTLADTTQVDLYGIVNFVGRIQVENIQRKAQSPWRQKECYRWIRIMDENHNEVACKIYANTQFHTFANEVLEGQVMFLKEFRVHSITPTARASDRIFWCSSTPYSRIYALATNGNESEVDVILGSNTMQYVRDNNDVMVRLLEERLVQRDYFGETIHIPITGSFALYKEAFPRTEAIQLRELRVIEEKLDLFECRTFLLNHFVTDISFRPQLLRNTTVEPVPNEPGRCECVAGERVVYIANIRDLNDTHSEEVNFSMDLENLVEWTNDSAMYLICALLTQYEVNCDPEEYRSLADLSKRRLMGERPVRFTSLLSVYRRSYTEVERNVVFVRLDEDK